MCAPCREALRQSRKKRRKIDPAGRPNSDRICGCGAPVPRQLRTCLKCRTENHKAAEHRKRVKRRGAPIGDKYTLAEIAERDRCKCHLCGKRVRMSLSGMHPKGPTIDHLIPVSQGGIDERKNVALAHRQCNIDRNVGGEVQLRLVG